jgi:hypothetical protein
VIDESQNKSIADLIKCLRAMRNKKPRDMRRLSNMTRHFFKNSLPDDQVNDLLKRVVSLGYVVITSNEKISYALPKNG